MLLKAIAASDGTRASVTSNLFGIDLTDTVLGNFAINDAGDTNQGSMTIYQATNGKLGNAQVITPPANLVQTG